MKSTLLSVLPQELIIEILEFMDPHEYSGLSCTCRFALSLVNEKLDTPEGRRFGFPDNHLSRTAAFVAQHRLWIAKLLEENGWWSGCSRAAEVERFGNDPDL